MVFWQGAIDVLSTFVSVNTDLKTIYRQYRRTARSVEYVDNYQKGDQYRFLYLSTKRSITFHPITEARSRIFQCQSAPFEELRRLTAMTRL